MTGRVAIVIGASSGIGAALTRCLARDGYSVYLMARRLERLQEVAATIGPSASVQCIDLANADGAAQSLRSLMARLGTVHLVVIASGTGNENASLDWPMERETLQVNVMGFAAAAGAAIQHFQSTGGGHLVGISSIAALFPNGPTASYCASKAFDSMYLDALRLLVRKQRGITVTDIQPGFVRTAMMKSAWTVWVATPEKAAEQILHAIRKRRRRAYITRRWTIVAWLLRRLLPR